MEIQVINHKMNQQQYQIFKTQMIGGKTNMDQKTLKQEAEEYEPATKTKNIAELAEVSTDLKTEDDSFTFTEPNGQEKTVNQKVVVIDGEKYRVPLSVIGSLKVILEDKPDLKKFKVKRTGTKKSDTVYTVIGM